MRCSPPLGVLAALLCLMAHAPARASEPDPAAGPRAVRVLFIGNSYTKFNNLPGMVERLSEGFGGAATVEAKKNLQPGATLRHQWLRGGAVEAIQRGGYTHVVLQAHSLDPFDRPDELEKYARLFRQEIRRVGARPVLYETWARRDQHFLYRKKPELGSPREMTAALERVYGSLGMALEADVAPVGRAFLLAAESMPDVTLYKSDGTHPSDAGTYLAACVFYGLLTGASPEGSTFAPHPMHPGVAARLQRVAALALGAPSPARSIPVQMASAPR